MLILPAAALALILIQDPPGTAAVPPATRSAEQAQVDVCLYTPAQSRDASCEPLLLQEARLVPDEAFAGSDPSSLGWANIVCGPDRLAEGQSRAECRTDQRDRFRRAERARQALGYGVASGLVTESAGYNVGPATTAASDRGLGLVETRQAVGDNCVRRAEARRDEEAGESSSSYSLTCGWGDGDAEMRERLNDTMDAILDD
jgi:hypothetical protein